MSGCRADSTSLCGNDLAAFAMSSIARSIIVDALGRIHTADRLVRSYEQKEQDGHRWIRQ
jgi:hypothetical protein